MPPASFRELAARLQGYAWAGLGAAAGTAYLIHLAIDSSRQDKEIARLRAEDKTGAREAK